MERSHRPTQLTPTVATPQPSVESSGNKVVARLPTGESVEILLFGATVTSWKNADGTENLWLSEKAILDGSKPVRGGIPVVFPVFGPPPKSGHATSSLPQHGFARNVKWEYLGKASSEESSGTGVKLDFGLYPSALPANFKSAWPLDFGLLYSITLTSSGLRTAMQVRNEGKTSFDFQFLLHTYLRIKDVTSTKVTGLVGVQYVDKVLDASTHVQSNPNITIAGEVDRVYKQVPQNTTSVVTNDGPRFDVVRDNLSDVVVWNPWIEKANGMGDFYPKDGYKTMICVEVGCVDGWQTLDAGESWEGGQQIISL